MCTLSEEPPETVSGAIHGWRRGRNHHQLGGRLQLAMAWLRGDVMKSLLSARKVSWWQLVMALRSGGNGLRVPCLARRDLFGLVVLALFLRTKVRFIGGVLAGLLVPFGWRAGRFIGQVVACFFYV